MILRGGFPLISQLFWRTHEFDEAFSRSNGVEAGLGSCRPSWRSLCQDETRRTVRLLYDQQVSTVLRLFLPTPVRAEADFFSKTLHGGTRRICSLTAYPINKVGGIELALRGHTASQSGARVPISTV